MLTASLGNAVQFALRKTTKKPSSQKTRSVAGLRQWCYNLKGIAAASTEFVLNALLQSII